MNRLAPQTVEKGAVPRHTADIHSNEQTICDPHELRENCVYVDDIMLIFARIPGGIIWGDQLGVRYTS